MAALVDDQGAALVAADERPDRAGGVGDAIAEVQTSVVEVCTRGPVMAAYALCTA